MRTFLILLTACGAASDPVDISQNPGPDLGSATGGTTGGTTGGGTTTGGTTGGGTTGGTTGGGTTGGGGLCGGTLCRTDQSCVSGQCQFSCSGVTVPGMFPTLASAASSLEGTGGTICVGAHTFTGSEAVPYNRALTIIGVSPDQSIFQSRVDLSETTSRTSNTPANLIIKGIAIQAGMTLELSTTIHDHLLVTASRVRGLISASPNAAQIVLDGDDLTNDAQNPAIDIVGVFDHAPSPAITIQNCFIHDSGIGIHHLEPTAITPIAVVNNTFLNTTTALIGDGTVASLAANNLMAFCLNAGVDIAGAAWTLHNNSYFQTGSNTPPPGTSDVTIDPMLDTQLPPALKTGSPCRGAGDPAVAPATDFFGRARGSAADIGARQEP